MQPHIVSAELQMTCRLSDGAEIELDVPMLTFDNSPHEYVRFDEVHPDRDLTAPGRILESFRPPKTWMSLRARVRPIDPSTGVLYTIQAEVPMTQEERITFLERALESAIVTLEAPGDHVDRSRRGAETAEALRARLERSRRA